MDDITLGNRARELMNDDALMQVFKLCRERYVGQMVNPNSTDENVLHSRRKLLALGQLQLDMRNIVTQGEKQVTLRKGGTS